MQIKDESELANVLGMAFNGYANRVQRGLVYPYRGFLQGDKKVIVSISLDGGELQVEEGPDVDGLKAENRYLQKKVEEKDKEIASLNLLLEEQKPLEIVEPDDIIVDGVNMGVETTAKPTKEKRRTKK